MPELTAGEIMAAMDSMTREESDWFRTLMKEAEPDEIQTVISFWHYFPGVKLLPEGVEHEPVSD